MHLFKNSVSFLAIISVCGTAFALAPGRVGVNAVASTATRRLPSLSNLVKTPVSTATLTSASSSSTSSSNLYEDSECIDKYRECMKGDNACGSDFSECTTNVLFHGHMSECFSTLYQCSAGGINSLFGTSNISALSNVDSYVDGTDNTEVARYTYPTDGSVMGIDIIGAATRNKLSTANCVKKYKSCLAKDNVCGEDFELCTSGDEFKKQAAMCDSTLSRCQKEGFQQLFGDDQTVKPVGNKLKATAGDVAKWIEDGASLAATNAVNTCYKVTDTCFLNACAKNPYRCVEGVNFNTIAAADFVAELTSNSSNTNNVSSNSSSSDVRKFFRAACQDTIGANKYCYMTFYGKMASQKDLSDPDTREEIFDEAYNARNRKDILGTKFTDLIQKFDTNAKNKCIDTFKTCAVRSCGGGSGAACYAAVFGGSGNGITTSTYSPRSINDPSVYNGIHEGCSAVINTDANCKYMAATMSESNNVYNYTFSDSNAFSTLFPPRDADQNLDAYPVIAALNKELSTAYNDVAIAQMKKQCQNLVENCAKSMCGKDYQNCYRHRSDIALGAYATESDVFNKSMNKIGGVLDYTIVQGLCASTVENANACEETLAIAKLDADRSELAGWGDNGDSNIASAWRNSAKNYGSNSTVTETYQKTDANGRKLCTCKDNTEGVCETEVNGVTGCNTAVMISKDVKLSQAALNTIFQEALAKVELNAQAQYKAKLTKEQNVCWAQDKAHGAMDTFVWAKLKTKKVPDGYAVKGLGNSSDKSDEVYDSFCRVNVSLRSSDKDIQNYFEKNASNAYFAANDAFTCGSWLSSDAIDKISAKVAEAKTGTNADGDRTSEQKWGAAGIGILSMVAGGVGTDLLQTKTGLGGFLGTTSAHDDKSKLSTVDDAISRCVSAASTVKSAASTVSGSKTNLTQNQINSLINAIGDLKSAYKTVLSNLGISGDEKWDDQNFKTSDFKEGQQANTDTISTAADTISTDCLNKKTGTEYTDIRDNKDESKAGRIVTDIVGAGITSAAGWVATSKIQRAKNKREFTEAQQEWMKEIGSKIQCYVGNEYVGDFGDTISLDITED